MDSKGVERLIKLAEDKLKKGVIKKEALESFMRAGILDSNGNFTKPYARLKQLYH